MPKKLLLPKPLLLKPLLLKLLQPRLLLPRLLLLLLRRKDVSRLFSSNNSKLPLKQKKGVSKLFSSSSNKKREDARKPKLYLSNSNKQLLLPRLLPLPPLLPPAHPLHLPVPPPL